MSHFEYGGKAGKVKYIISKIDGNRYCKTNGHFTTHLKANNLSDIEYYLKYVGNPEYCPYCTDLRGFNEYTWEFREICGNKCLSKFRSENYHAMSPDEKRKWKERSSSSVKEFFSTDEGKASLKKAAESNKIVSKQARAKRIITLKKKYGSEWYNSEKANITKSEFSTEKKLDIDKRRDTTNYSKYGKSKCSEPARQKRATWAKEYLIPASKAYCLENYGTDNISVLSKSAISNSSLNFFNELAIGLEGAYFGNNEWYISDKKFGFFKYDFKYKNKIIEFNGDYWHANPNRYEPYDIVPYPGGKQILAMDIWEKDLKKIRLAISKEFEVKIIWERDVKSRKYEILEELKLWMNV